MTYAFLNNKTGDFRPGRVKEQEVACWISLENNFFEVINDQSVALLALAELLLKAVLVSNIYTHSANRNFAGKIGQRKFIYQSLSKGSIFKKNWFHDLQRLVSVYDNAVIFLILVGYFRRKEFGYILSILLLRVLKA